MKPNAIERAATLAQMNQNAAELMHIFIIGIAAIVLFWTVIFLCVEYSMHRKFQRKAAPLVTDFTVRCEKSWNAALLELEKVRFENFMRGVFPDREYALDESEKTEAKR